MSTAPAPRTVSRLTYWCRRCQRAQRGADSSMECRRCKGALTAVQRGEQLPGPPDSAPAPPTPPIPPQPTGETPLVKCSRCRRLHPEGQHSQETCDEMLALDAGGCAPPVPPALVGKLLDSLHAARDGAERFIVEQLAAGADRKVLGKLLEHLGQELRGLKPPSWLEEPPNTRSTP